MKFIFLFSIVLFFSGNSFGLSHIAGPATICTGSTGLLTDSTAGGTWTSASPTIASIGITSGLVSGVSSGTAVISYTVVDTTVTYVVTIAPIVHPSVTISANTGDTVCAGTWVTYTANVTNGGASPSFEWMVNDMEAGIEDTLGYYPAVGDTVLVKVTSNAACVSPDTADAWTAPVVLPALIPSVYISSSPGVVVQAGSYDTLTAHVTTGSMSNTYEWIVNAAVVAGVTDSIYLTDSLVSGDSVTCVVTSVGQCGGYSAFNSVTYTVVPSSVPMVTNTGTFSIYPNPVSDQLTIKGIGLRVPAVQLTITDFLDRNIYAETFGTSSGACSAHVATSQWADGLYLLKLSGISGQLLSTTTLLKTNR